MLSHLSNQHREQEKKHEQKHGNSHGQEEDAAPTGSVSASIRSSRGFKKVRNYVSQRALEKNAKHLDSRWQKFMHDLEKRQPQESSTFSPATFLPPVFSMRVRLQGVLRADGTLSSVEDFCKQQGITSTSSAFFFWATSTPTQPELMLHPATMNRCGTWATAPHQKSIAIPLDTQGKRVHFEDAVKQHGHLDVMLPWNNDDALVVRFSRMHKVKALMNSGSQISMTALGTKVPLVMSCKLSVVTLLSRLTATTWVGVWRHVMRCT
jgi:hypothetical protein